MQTNLQTCIETHWIVSNLCERISNVIVQEKVDQRQSELIKELEEKSKDVILDITVNGIEQQSDSQ